MPATAATVGMVLIHFTPRGFPIRVMVVLVLVVVSEVVGIPVLPMASVASLMLLLLLVVVTLRRSIIVVVPSTWFDVRIQGLEAKGHIAAIITTLYTIIIS
jgi:hypothetical protein